MPFLAAIPVVAAVAGAGASAAGAAGIISTTTASLLAAGASAVGAASGALASSQAQASQARYQAQVAQNNQITANQNATLATQQADATVQADYRAGAIKVGAQRAALGANGGTLDTGSAADVQKSTAEYNQLAVSNDQYQGDLTAYSLRSQGVNYGAQAGLDKLAASNDGTAGAIGAAGSIAGGASQFSSKWAQYYGPPSSAGTGTSLQGGNLY